MPWLVLAAALACCTAADAPPPPNRRSPGEIWSAFFAFNGTDTSCSADAVGARLYAARFAPTASNAGAYHYLSDITYALAPLVPIHSKTLTLKSGNTMAVDAVGRRAWALLGTTDWSSHAWVLQLSFPSRTFNQTRVEGICEIVDSYMASTPYLIQGLTYSSTVVKVGRGGVWVVAEAA